LRQLEFALLDLHLHTHKVPGTVGLLDRNCKKITDRCSVLEKFKGYSMYTSFDHVFSGGYAAGYYSYIWAEILEADVFLKMKKSGILKPQTGLNYYEKVLKQGAKKPGMEIFRDFMGRNPDVGAFIKKHDL
jgi:oligopeptidase A